MRIFCLFCLALALCSCQSLGGFYSQGLETVPQDPAALQAYVQHWQEIYSAHAGEKYASINYARGLRAVGRAKEAAAVMQRAAVKATKDFEVLGEYGKSLADAGEFLQARDVLSRSYTSDRPNWNYLSVQGTVEDQLENHARAQELYHDALSIVPNEPSVLNNLGMSYLMSKKLDDAEATLRLATTQPNAEAKVYNNLALVLALEGKFQEAELVSQHNMSPDAAKSNVEAIRQMIEQRDSWRALQGKSRAPVALGE